MMIRKQVYQWELTPANSFGNQSDGSWQATINTFGGGVVEVLRGLVATHGLGMPQHR